MNDEEKDLYIKAKIKDGHIPEKIDNLFNNSTKIIENKGEEKMEERKNENTEENLKMDKDNQKQSEKKKMPVAAKRVIAAAACLTVLLGGGNLYATSKGYDNVFFLIMQKLGISTDTFGKENILSDRDITISYKPIEIARGTQLQVNSLVIKNNEAKLKVQLKETETDEKTAPLTYVVKDENGTELYTSVVNNTKILSGDVNCDGKVNGKDLIRLKKYLSGQIELTEEQKANADLNQDGTIDSEDKTILTKQLLESEEDETSSDETEETNNTIQYKEEWLLSGYKEDTKKLILEIYQNGSEKIVDIEIDLEKKQINIVGNAEEVRKISEEELKKYLSAFAMLNCDESKYNKNLTENEKKTITALLIAESKATSVDVELYKKSKTEIKRILDKEKIHEFIKSFTDLELNEKGVMDFKEGDMFNTITYKGKTEYIYEKDEIGCNPTCLDVTDISYVNGIYNVAFRFCYSTTENKGFGDISVEDLPVYEMTIGLILDENNEYSKYRVSTMSDPKLIIKEEKNDTKETIKKEDESKDYVYERESYSIKIPGYNENEIKIPYINIDSEDAKNINKEIYKMYEEAVKTVEENGNAEHKMYTDLKYKFTKHENMISICIIKTPGFTMGSGGNRYKIISYNISLENGKKLSVSDVLKKFDLKESDLELKIKEELQKDYKSIDEPNIKSMFPTGIEYANAYTYDIYNTYFGAGNIAVIGIDAEYEYGSSYLEINLVKGEIEQVLQNYVDLMDAYTSTPADLLYKLELMTKQEFDKIITSNTSLYKTDIKFIEYKEAMLNYVSENLFNQKFATLYNKTNDANEYLQFEHIGGSIGTNEVESVDFKGEIYIAKVHTIASDGVLGSTYEIKFLTDVAYDKNGNKITVISYCDDLRY